MFRIIKEQLRTLGLLAQQNFVDEMVEHLQTFTPAHARSIGPAAIKHIIEMGLPRAGHYRFTQRGPVRLYIELMFLFGSDFDTDPQYVWAADILNRGWDGEPQLRRATDLFGQTNRFLEAVAGPQKRYALEGLRRAHSCKLFFTPTPEEPFADQMLQAFCRLAPEKYAFVGPKQLDLLIHHGIAKAQSYQAQTLTDQCSLILLMFWLGHGCLEDPQFPWIQLTLEKRPTHPERDVFEALRRKALVFLKSAIDNSKNQQAVE